MPINTLYDYYQQQGQTLPKWQDRAIIWENLGLGSKDEYTGTANQNDKLLQSLLSQGQTIQQPSQPVQQTQAGTQNYQVSSDTTADELANSLGLRLSQLLDLNLQLKSRQPKAGETIVLPTQEVLDYANSRGVSLNQAIRDNPQIQPQQPLAVGITPPQPTQSPTGNLLLDETLSSIKKLIDDLNKRGQIVNPYVELTPEKQLEFLTMARGEVSPYYETQLKLAKDSLYQDLSYSTEQILQKEADLERQYSKGLRTLTGQFEETGLLYSGERQKSERELAEATQREIETGRRALQFGAGQQARQFAQLYGGTALTTPQIQQAPRVLAGVAGFEKPTTTEGLYTLSPEVYNDLIGERQKERELGARSLASGYETAFKEGELAKRYRALEI